MLRRLVGLLVALLAALLSAPVPSEAAASALPIVTYTYDGHHDAAVWTFTTTERGPPEAYEGTTTYDVVDSRSHGAWARPSLDTLSTAHTYDDSAPLVQVARAAATTQGRARVAGGRDVVFEPSGVAAKSADEVLGALSYSTKIEGQMATRGWTKEAIETTIHNPTATHTVWDLTSGTKQAATAYVQRGGGYVVLNDETRAVVQISNLNKTGWKPVWEDPRFMR